MLIWKQVPSSGMMGSGMMGGRITTGIIMPEPGPNMMWNTKYSYMGSGMMGTRNQPLLNHDSFRKPSRAIRPGVP